MSPCQEGREGNPCQEGREVNPCHEGREVNPCQEGREVNTCQEGDRLIVIVIDNVENIESFTDAFREILDLSMPVRYVELITQSVFV